MFKNVKHFVKVQSPSRHKINLINILININLNLLWPSRFRFFHLSVSVSPPTLPTDSPDLNQMFFNYSKINYNPYLITQLKTNFSTSPASDSLIFFLTIHW